MGAEAVFWKPVKGKGQTQNTMKNPEGSKSNKKLTTNSDMKMADENSLALKVISLEKSMVTVVKALKELRANVKLLEEKLVPTMRKKLKK